MGIIVRLVKPSASAGSIVEQEAPDPMAVSQLNSRGRLLSAHVHDMGTPRGKSALNGRIDEIGQL
jgi:hypothetical protein